jgi:RNA polymerase sigma factor (sigma-70 family)
MADKWQDELKIKVTQMSSSGFYEFVRGYFTNVARYKVSATEDIEDVVSQTILKLYMRLGSEDRIGWMRLGSKILNDEIVNYYRRSARNSRLETKLESLHPTQPPLDANLELTEDYDSVMDLIEQYLGALDKAIIALHIAGYSDEEIIEMLGLPVVAKTVSNRRKTAFNKLRSLYTK